MRFTIEDPETSCDPTAAMHDARSVVTCGICYYGDLPPKPFPRATRIAAFARRDFYSELRTGLEKVAEVLRGHGYKAVVPADSNRPTDRPPAIEAGVGRYGKNSMVITDSYGSWVLLGSILTTAALPLGVPAEPACGPCSVYLRRCPTGAILEAGVPLNPTTQRAKTDSWRPLKADRAAGEGDFDDSFWVDPVDVLEASDHELRRRFGHF